MSESPSSPVFMFEGDDPEMAHARQEARATFAYFWRELAWERRRIIPALDFAGVKAPFSDGPRGSGASADKPSVEEMWISEVDFDGGDVSGELLNQPNWLKSIKQGDAVRLPLERVSDWMYVINGQVFGAFTVQLIRSRMRPKERAEHDQAWGLNFGDPGTVRIVVEPASLAGDHPMSVNMGPSLQEAIASDPSFMSQTDHRGWTYLHQLALAGSTTGVKVLLDAGADPNLRTPDGRTAAQLADTLGWDDVVKLLAARRRMER
jgi:uncharacterized protein YegJ (DUF2314 family)